MNERSLFLASLEILDPAKRSAYLDEACAGNEAVRRGVEDLLAAHARSGTFMPAPPGGEVTADYLPDEAAGSRVGPYKLLQQVGEGGMGSVYMAEQEEPIRRMVAVKIIRAGMDCKGVLARFEAERQALAMMDHPNIAKVLDTGTTASGRPFFVMELVKGVPITKFCDEHQLTLRERLELFIPVCQAVQHAHQKGVIHRDIKPSNVLVALYDDKPVPKVIDFGVAKATHQKLTEKTLFTAFGSVVGTLEYMSPEQATLNQLDIDTRSDVYGLGVLLYEILTGTTPLDRVRLKAAAFDEVLRLIREEEPERPSTRLSTHHTPAQIASSRRSEPAQLGRVVRGELDWIVMKALEKDRTRRFQTANAMARDIQRYLGDEAVEACPPTLGYRLSKMYRKNRAAVGVAAAFLIVLAGAAAVSTALAIQARRAERVAVVERNRAEEEKQSAQAVRDFLQNDLLRQASMLEQAEALRLSGDDFAVMPNPTVNELLDRAAAQLAPDRIEAKFPKLPSVQAEVLKTVGDAYYSLRQDEKGRELLKRAVELYRSARGADDPATLSARYKVGLIDLVQGRLDDAQALFESVRSDQVRVCGPHHRDTFTTRMGLGLVYMWKKRPAEAVVHFQQLRDEARRHFGPDDRDTVRAAGNLAVALREAGRVKEAVRELESIRDTFRRLQIRADHPGFQVMVTELATAYKTANRDEEALALLEETLQSWADAGDPTNPATWLHRHQLAWEYMRLERTEEAVKLFEQNIAAAAPPSDEVAHEALYSAYMKSNRLDDALAAIQKAQALVIQRKGPDHRSYQMGRIRARMGLVYFQQENYDKAEPLLIGGYDEMNQHPEQKPQDAPFQQETIRKRIVEMYKAMNRPEEVKKWAANEALVLKEELRRLRKGAAIDKPDTLKATAMLANAFVNSDRQEDAFELFQETFARLQANGWPLDEGSLNSLSKLRYAVRRAGRFDLAAEMSAAIVAEFRKLPARPENQYTH
jgi:serine/threonine protein kinase/tetratricopeptide (TPR) repeat protein